MGGMKDKSIIPGYPVGITGESSEVSINWYGRSALKWWSWAKVDDETKNKKNKIFFIVYWIKNQK